MPITVLTTQEIERLRASFFVLIPVTDDLAESFYARLFEAHPEVRPFFKGDLQTQQDKLIDTLAALLDTLEKPDVADQMLRDLGHRHVAYGATPELYDWVEWAILDMVGNQVGPEEAEDLTAIWGKLLRHVSETMLAGASSETSP